MSVSSPQLDSLEPIFSRFSPKFLHEDSMDSYVLDGFVRRSSSSSSSSSEASTKRPRSDFAEALSAALPLGVLNFLDPADATRLMGTSNEISGTLESSPQYWKQL